MAQVQPPKKAGTWCGRTKGLAPDLLFGGRQCEREDELAVQFVTFPRRLFAAKSETLPAITTRVRLWHKAVGPSAKIR